MKYMTINNASDFSSNLDVSFTILVSIYIKQFLLSFSVEERETVAHYYHETPLSRFFCIKLSSIAQFGRERGAVLVSAAYSFHGDLAVDPGPRSNKHALLLTAQGRAPWLRTGLSFSHSISSGRGAGALYSQRSDRMFILHIKKFRLNQPTPALGRRILAPLRGHAQKCCFKSH
jgi:hypothetical protein